MDLYFIDFATTVYKTGLMARVQQHMLPGSEMAGTWLPLVAGFPLPVSHASFGELKWLAMINHSHPFRHAGEWQRRFKPWLVGLPIVCIGKINIDHL